LGIDGDVRKRIRMEKEIRDGSREGFSYLSSSNFEGIQ